MEFIAPEGVSTESEASAKDVAKIIRQIKAEKVPAVFMENITDHRLLDQIASETGAKIGGTLYTDALSPPSGPAATYLDMFRHNIETLSAALSSWWCRLCWHHSSRKRGGRYSPPPCAASRPRRWLIAYAALTVG